MVEDVMTRLRTAIEDVDVQDSIDFSEARREHQRDTIYVLEGDETGGPNEDSDGGVLQRVAVSLLLLVAVTNRRPRGSGARRTLEQRKDQVIGALAGFKPAGMADPLTFGRSQLLGFFDGTGWRQIEFHTAEWIQA